MSDLNSPSSLSSDMEQPIPLRQPLDTPSQQNPEPPPPCPQGNARRQAEKPAKKNSCFFWGCGIVILLCLIFVGLCTAFIFGFGTSIAGELATTSFAGLKEDKNVSKTIIESSQGTAGYVAVINVVGIIQYSDRYDLASARRLVVELTAAREDPDVVAIVLDMNTPGGEVVASDEILNQVRLCRKAGKPVVTCMRSMGASGGYFIASGSDWIVANRLTFTGSIGVIIQSMQIKGLLDKIGIQPETYRSGNMKDMLSPTRERTEQETAYIQQMIDASFHEFCQVVADGREAFQTAEDVKNSPFGDGRVVSGVDALNYGLVDQLGYFSDAIAKAKELGHCPGAGVSRFTRSFDFWDFFLSSSQSRLNPLGSVAERTIPAIKPGCLYYLAPEVLGLNH